MTETTAYRFIGYYPSTSFSNFFYFNILSGTSITIILTKFT